MPKVLLITYDYLPGYHVGAERMVKFEKYLPDFGFRTCVLTKGSRNLTTDLDRRVYRAFDPGEFYRLLALRLRPRTSSYDPEDAKENNPVSLGKRVVSKFLGRLRGILDRIAVPDLQITWLPSAIWLGLKTIKSEKVDIILSSSRPETAHLVAAILSKMTKVPWVADFRDGWIFEPLKSILRSNNLRRKMEQKLEGWVVSRANAVISVSLPITEYFSANFPTLKGKFFTIPNGYDPEDWQDVQSQKRSSRRFRVVHTGRLSMSRPNLDPRPFLDALQALPEEVKSQMEMLWVGELAEREQVQLRRGNSGGWMRIVGQVSRQESLAYQTSSDCLLLLVGNDKSVCTSKLFEYLFARRPILAISAPDTAAAAIIRESEAGEVADPANAQAIADCLNRFFHRWQNGDLACLARGIGGYERKELTRQLAEVFTWVLST